MSWTRSTASTAKAPRAAAAPIKAAFKRKAMPISKRTSPTWTTSSPPPLSLEPPRHHLMSATTEVAILKTSEGELVLEFWPDVAPNHVKNFTDLAKKGFYDGTCFHRVIRSEEHTSELQSRLHLVC